MDLNDYLQDHIPHRVNLLITYRERFGPVGPDTISVLNREVVRDLYRCAKDSAIIMVRYFFLELGVRLKQGTTELVPDDKHSLGLPYFDAKRLLPSEVDAVAAKPAVIAALIVANRGVAHMDKGAVDDGISDTQLLAAIDFTEGMIRERIYRPDLQGRPRYEAVMKLATNQMHRGELTQILRRAGR